MYIVPYQWAWVLAKVGLTEAECRQAAWAVSPTGETYRGAAAINTVLDRLIGFGRPFYTIYRLPLVKQLQDSTYQWVAGNRRRFRGVTPAIKQDPPWQPQRESRQ